MPNKFKVGDNVFIKKSSLLLNLEEEEIIDSVKVLTVTRIGYGLPYPISILYCREIGGSKDYCFEEQELDFASSYKPRKLPKSWILK